MSNLDVPKGRIVFQSIIFCVGILLAGCQTIDPETLTSLEVPVEAGDQIRAFHFFDPMHGIAVGGRRWDKDLILYTEDGGQHWVQKPTEPTLGKMVFSVSFWNDTLGMATGLDGKVLRTRNGGQSWQTLQGGIWMPMHGVAFVDDSIAIAVGGDGYDVGQITRTTDQGTSWEVIDSLGIELRDVAFISDQIGFACGFGTLLKTIDAGQSWTYEDPTNDFFVALDFPTPQIGWLVGRGGNVYQTTDGGESWSRVRNGNLPWMPRHQYHDISFWDEQHGYLVGDEGLVRWTEDGGASWGQLEVQTDEHLHGIVLTSARTGFIGGKSGVLLAFRR